MSGRLPIVGIPCDHRMVGAHPFHMVGEKYITAVRDGAGALPLLIPSLDPPLPAESVLESVDGLLLTGSPSNVAPKLYGGPAPRDGVLQDERRDATSLGLLKAAIAAGVPTLCVCRGFQELNVAFGGTLHQHLHEVEGRSDHREDKTAPLEIQYGPSHEVRVSAGSVLGKIVGVSSFRVNSLHSQGIDRLAEALHADAIAPDGQIEAVSMPGARGFVLGVQWHPEWRWSDDPVSRAIFGAFGEALSQRTTSIRRA
jgi:putative glutamine amidotransferase